MSKAIFLFILITAFIFGEDQDIDEWNVRHVNFPAENILDKGAYSSVNLDVYKTKNGSWKGNISIVGIVRSGSSTNFHYSIISGKNEKLIDVKKISEHIFTFKSASYTGEVKIQKGKNCHNQNSTLVKFFELKRFSGDRLIAKYVLPDSEGSLEMLRKLSYLNWSYYLPLRFREFIYGTQ